MILDGLLQFSSAQPIAAAGNTDSTNIIDLGINNGIPTSAAGGGARDLGVGDDPALKFAVSIAALFVGNGTLQATILTAPDNGAGQPGTWTTALSGPAVAVGSFAAGSHILEVDMPRPAPGAPLPRFVKITYIASAAFTAGAVNAYLVLDRSDRPRGATGLSSGYPENFSVPN